MRHFKTVFLIFFFFSSFIFAQTPWKVWDKEFSFGGNIDELYEVSDYNGGYITGGYYLRYIPPPPQSIYTRYPALAHFSSQGSLIWKLVDSSQGKDIILSLVKVPEEESFIVGTAFRIQKRSFTGQIIWQKDVQNAIRVAAGNNFFVATTMEENLVKFLKFTAAGDSLDYWELEQYAFARVFKAAIRNELIYVFGITPGGSTLNFSGKILVQNMVTKEILWTRIVDNMGRMFGTIDDSGNIYVSGTWLSSSPDPSEWWWWRTEKYNPNGTLLWFRLWNGDSTFSYNHGNWVNNIIPYPGGGCVVIGALTHQNPWKDPNDLDFAVIAYDNEGNRRWSMRWPPRPGWRRGDLSGVTWDKQGYLILAGSGVATTIPPDTRKCFLLKFYVPGVTSVTPIVELPVPTFTLFQNYPNPFNQTTTIEFSLPEKMFVTLKVTNILGQEIAILVREKKEPGFYRVSWNAENLPSGIYFYCLELEPKAIKKIKKMVLLK